MIKITVMTGSALSKIYFLLLLLFQTVDFYEIDEEPSTTTPSPSTTLSSSLTTATTTTTTSFSEKNTCPEQMQPFQNETIIWPATDSTAVSKPMCIAENMEFLKRSCIGGNWEDPPKCSTVQKDIHPCPDDFHYVKSSNVCYTIMKSVSFDTKCPYTNTLSFNDYQNILDNITDGYFWMPLKRNDEMDDTHVGVYVWVEPNFFYGVEDEEHQITYDGTILGKPCVIANNQNQLQAVPCESKHQKICVYNALDENTDGFCTDNFKHSGCYQSTFDFTTCFCVVNRPNEACTKKAEFIQPYQNSLASTFSNFSCWIGLEKTSDGFRWSTTKKTLEYTFWANHTSFNYTHVGVGLDGWALHPEDTLSCSFCEYEFTPTKPTLHLMYNEPNNEFLLLVTYYKGLRTLVMKMKKTKALCFFHAGTDTMYYRFKFLMSIYESDVHTFYTFLPVDFGPGYYWCEGFKYPHLTRVVSNKLFLYDQKRFGHEYVGKATFGYRQGTNPLSQKFYTRIHSFLMSYMKTPPNTQTYFVSYLVSLRRFKITTLDEVTKRVQFLMHISTRSKSFDNIDDEFTSIRDLFVNAVEKINGTVEEFSSTNYCYREEVSVDGKTLTFPTVPNGEMAIPAELCFQEDGQPVSRKCEGDFIHGAHWSEIVGRCAKNIPKSEVTDDLNELLEGSHPVETIIGNLTAISQHYESFHPVDVYLTGRILRRLSHFRNTSLENITRIVCNTNNIDQKILDKSQEVLNATDNILINYDSILKNSDILDKDTQYFFRSDNLVLSVSDINRNNISGVALVEENNTITIKILNTSTTIQEISLDESIKTALLVDPILVEQIRNASEFRLHQKLIVSVFHNDALFNENSTKNKWCESVIFSVVIPNFEEEFLAPIRVYVGGTDNGGGDPDKTCAHWQICTENNCNSRSFWVENSGNITSVNSTDSIVCDFWHATHFALLVVDNFKKLKGGINLDVLNVMSGVNCLLSLTGLCCILLTCLLFKNWRQNTGNRVLVNFVLALTMQITLLYISNAISDGIDSKMCIFIGAMLHYSVISEFCWMFVIGVLQYKRLVTVFLKPTKNLLLKTCVVGWILPLFPVLVLLYASPENYTRNTMDTCYPTGRGLYYGVLLPIGAIITANFTIFCVILYNIFHSKTEKMERYSYELVFQWKTIILLFFMLGLTWVFALLSYLESGVIFIYLFCFTATLQGFIVFVFFIVFNKHTRLMYRNFLKRLYQRYY